MMITTRILMVDDHGLFREGLGRLLDATPELSVVGQCSNIDEALATLARTKVDLILLDYDLGPEFGTRLLTKLRDSISKPKILMVTAGMTDRVTMEVLEAGVSGIFLKHSSPDQLVVAIQQVSKGEIWLDKQAMRTLVSSGSAQAEQVAESPSLTLRQSDVLRGILDGLTNKEIAWNLGSSESSIKAVIQELFRKAGVRTRSQLVRIAIEEHSSDWLRG
jgi:two-component system, NarL family, nitrate/nitrite response regulator NarL